MQLILAKLLPLFHVFPRFVTLEAGLNLSGCSRDLGVVQVNVNNLFVIILLLWFRLCLCRCPADVRGNFTTAAAINGVGSFLVSLLLPLLRYSNVTTELQGEPYSWAL